MNHFRGSVFFKLKKGTFLNGVFETQPLSMTQLCLSDHQAKLRSLLRCVSLKRKLKLAYFVLFFHKGSYVAAFTPEESMAAQRPVFLLLWFFQINQYMRDSLSPGTASPPSHGVSHLGGFRSRCTPEPPDLPHPGEMAVVTLLPALLHVRPETEPRACCTAEPALNAAERVSSDGASWEPRAIPMWMGQWDSTSSRRIGAASGM